MQSTEVQFADESAINPAEVPFRLDVESLTIEHGEALRDMASILLADHTDADDAVSYVLSRAGSTLVNATDKGTRRRLSRQLYLNCTWAKLVSGYFQEMPLWLQQSSGGVVDTIARLREASEQQRAAIALFVYGDHTCRQVAELLALPAPVVLGLLRSGLEELHLDNNVQLAG